MAALIHLLNHEKDDLLELHSLLMKKRMLRQATVCHKILSTQHLHDHNQEDILTIQEQTRKNSKRNYKV